MEDSQPDPVRDGSLEPASGEDLIHGLGSRIQGSEVGSYFFRVRGSEVGFCFSRVQGSGVGTGSFLPMPAPSAYLVLWFVDGSGTGVRN